MCSPSYTGTPSEKYRCFIGHAKLWGVGGALGLSEDLTLMKIGLE